jgi:hypothetical protein
MSRLVLILLLAVSAQAAPLPDVPSASRAKPPNVYLSPFRDSWFYGGTLTAASGIIADVHFVQGCERDHTCYELNPGADTYKRRVPEVALVAVGAYGCSLMLHDHKWWRGVCAIGPVALGLWHWHDTHITYLKDTRLVK